MSLHRRDTNARVTAASIGDVTTPVDTSDPLLVVTQDLTIRREFPTGYGSDATAASGDDYVTKAYRVGDKVRKSALLASMTPAVVTAIAPGNGPAAGGTAITITGTGLDGVTAVTVGGTAATAVTVVDPRKVTCTTPAGTAGAKPVVLTDDAGAVTVPGGFTYQ